MKPPVQIRGRCKGLEFVQFNSTMTTENVSNLLQEHAPELADIYELLPLGVNIWLNHLAKRVATQRNLTLTEDEHATFKRNDVGPFLRYLRERGVLAVQRGDAEQEENHPNALYYKRLMHPLDEPQGSPFRSMPGASKPAVESLPSGDPARDLSRRLRASERRMQINQQQLNKVLENMTQETEELFVDLRTHVDALLDQTAGAVELKRELEAFNKRIASFNS